MSFLLAPSFKGVRSWGILELDRHPTFWTPKCIHWGSAHLRPAVSSRSVNSPSDIEKQKKTIVTITTTSDDHHRRESLTLITHHLVFQPIYTIQHVVWNHKCFRAWLDECMCMWLQKYVASNRQCCYHENKMIWCVCVCVFNRSFH